MEHFALHPTQFHFVRSFYRHLAKQNLWQFVIFGHNEQDLPKAREMANRLNMKFNPVINYDFKYSKIKNPGFVKQETGIDAEKIIETGFKKISQNFSWCSQLWDAPQINWDGKLLGCCINRFGDFGNVFEQGLETSLNSEKYQYAKEMLLGKKPKRDDIPCTVCEIYTASLSS